MVNTSSGARTTRFYSAQNFRSAINVIFGYIQPTGKFPVDVPKPGTAIGDQDFIRKVGEGLLFDISFDDRVVINLENWPEDDSAVFDPTFTLTSNEVFEVTLYVATYDKRGKLIAINSQSAILEPGIAVSLQSEIPRLDGTSYKFFIWDANYMPLTQRTSYSY
jgi:hypothetical protein